MTRSWGEPPWHADTLALAQANGDDRFHLRGRAAASLRAGEQNLVVIVGGGFTGLSAAYHLAKRGVEVALFEAENFGAGASGRTGGLVLEGTAEGIRPGVDDCVPFLERLVGDEQIDCGLELPGCWLIGHGDDSGTALPWRDDNRVIHVADVVTGGVVNPLALVRGLARIADKAGARLYENVPVTKITVEPLTVAIEGVTLHPRKIIVATNAWLGALLPPLRVGIRSCLTFAITTGPLSDVTRSATGLDGHPFYTIDQPYLWGRPLYDGGLLIGGGLVFGAPEQLEEIGASNSEVRAVFERIERRVRGLNPTLADVTIAARWGGPIAITSDYLPLIGALAENSDVIVAGGYTGHGVALGVKAGAMIADAIVDGKPLPSWASPAR
jgi:gamma-glutamylputrescine oxidase